MPNRTLKVGLTGGIASGKSEALKAFEAAGAEAVSLDQLAHSLCRKGGPAYGPVVRAFGSEVLGPDGEIDRRRLGELVFRRPGLRRRLEAATHPPILREMRRRLQACRRPVAVVDAPLLFEAGLEKDFDVTVLIHAGQRTRLRRMRSRDGLGRAAALRRVRAQMPMARKERLADIVLPNEGGLGPLRRRVREYQRAFELIARSLSTSPSRPRRQKRSK